MLIVLAIVIVLFGTKKLRNIGGDMGAAIRNFKVVLADESQQSHSGDRSKIIDAVAERHDD